MIWLEALHPFTRYAHIAFGTAGLLLVWLPLLFAKGSRRHVLAGRIFAWTAYGVIGFAGLGVVNYLLRLGLADGSAIGDGDLALIFMLGSLALAALSMLRQGVRLVAVKANARLLRTPGFVGLHALTFLSAVGLAVYAFIVRPPNLWILLIAGFLSFVVAHDGYRLLKRDTLAQHEWMEAHLNGMLGVGVAFYVAFGVFGSKMLFATDSADAGLASALAWLLPIAVIVPIMELWKRRVRRRYSGEPSTPPAHEDASA